MRTRFILMIFGLAVAFASSPSRSHAQMGMSGGGRSLGGYGASTIGSYYSTGSGASLPYNGNGLGFVGSRPGSGLGGSTSPISRRLPESNIGGSLMSSTPIGGGSFSSGMGSASRSGSAMSTNSAPRSFVPFGYEGGLGMGMGGGSSRMGTAQRGMPGPGFGYPFRMPPSLGGPSGMAMP
ncbi:hypothetical protein [Singulisphaera sp. PoT]|uniref:hypothetical protein n=1 Tax=Singulisphaera sp. PoT TaxID=3411797 RepID=UPI003BF49B48